MPEKRDIGVMSLGNETPEYQAGSIVKVNVHAAVQQIVGNRDFILCHRLGAWRRIIPGWVERDAAVHPACQYDQVRLEDTFLGYDNSRTIARQDGLFSHPFDP